jgi:hypothetical protein
MALLGEQSEQQDRHIELLQKKMTQLTGFERLEKDVSKLQSAGVGM